MITRNFYKMFGRLVPSGNNDDFQTKLKSVNGEIFSFKAPTNYYYDGDKTSYYARIGSINLIIGSGTEEENIENYTMTPITDGYVINNYFAKCSDIEYENDLCIIFSKTITNTSNENIVINEIGVAMSTSGTITGNKPFLLSRTKFATHIVIVPNETKTFTHKVSI